MKIIFMGTPEFAVPILRAIHESDNKIIEVYTQPATNSGRGQKFNHSDVFNWAKQLNLKVRFPESLKQMKKLNILKN